MRLIGEVERNMIFLVEIFGANYRVSFGDESVFEVVTEGQVTSCGAWCETNQPHHYHTFDVICATYIFNEE